MYHIKRRYHLNNICTLHLSRSQWPLGRHRRCNPLPLVCWPGMLVWVEKWLSFHVTCHGQIKSESRPILFALFLSHTTYNYAVWTEQTKTIVDGRTDKLERIAFSIVRHYTTGSLSSKYEHRLLRNIRNLRICMGKKPIVSVNYENERISIKKKQLTLLKMCVSPMWSTGRFLADLWVFI